MMPEPAILTRLGPGLKALLWIDQAPLSEASPYFETVNYLLDGLVRQHLRKLASVDQVSFVHTLFGESFWVIFANTATIDQQHVLTSLEAIIPEAARSHALVLGKVEASWLTPIGKFFGQLDQV